MLMGTVVGTVTTTVKDPSLEGVKLMIVRLSADSGGRLVVAADASHVAGKGDKSYLLTSKEAASAMELGRVPVDLAIAGIIDTRL